MWERTIICVVFSIPTPKPGPQPFNSVILTILTQAYFPASASVEILVRNDDEQIPLATRSTEQKAMLEIVLRNKSELALTLIYPKP